MRGFLDLAAHHELPVFWLLPPLSPTTQALREQQGHDAFYTRLVRKVQARYPNVTVVDARHSGFPHDVFTDPVHLDRDGAALLTRRLAAVLVDRLSSRELSADSPTTTTTARWVHLPPSPAGPLPTTPPLEDLDQSRLVLQEIDAHTRR